jgi:peptidoglycan/LPS O-acetylase OafA/YrhL
VTGALQETQQHPAAGAPTAAKERFYRPELDLLRFVAFVLVFCHHLLPDRPPAGVHPAWIDNLYLTVKYASGNGLCLFFLLSSYLITELLLRERESTGSIHMKAFYVRRVLRIWPLYFAFLGFGYLLGLVVPVLHISIPFVLQYVLLVGNLAFYHHYTTLSPLGPLWSISVEEQFYLCWPFLARSAGKRGLLILSLALIPISMIASAWLAFHAAKPGIAIWTNSFTEFECFGVGALLALGLHKKEWKAGVAARGALVALCAAAWFVSDGILHYKRDQLLANRDLMVQVGGFQLVVLGCGLIFLAMLSMPLGRWSKPLVYLGRISYGLYVFHILCRYIAMRVFSLAHVQNTTVLGLPNTAMLTLAFALTATMAILSYNFFEKPFLRMKSRFTFVKSRVD